MSRPSRRHALALSLAATLLASLALAPRAEAAEFTLKLGTLAPKSSPQGKVLMGWAKTIEEKSGGRVELQLFFNGSQGDESAMVGKMKSGGLGAAALSAVGLGKIYKPITSLQMPGLFSSWARLDAAREALSADLMKGASDAGFTVLGWYDIGRARAFSKGFAVRVPTDLRGKKPFLWRDDPIGGVVLQTIGKVTGVPLNIPEVLPNLNTGAVDALFASALEAEQYQWAGKLDTVGADVHAFLIGGIVMSSKQLDALPADLKNIVIDTAKVTANALTKRIRNEDDAAFARLSARMTVVTREAAEAATWSSILKQVRSRLGQGTFGADLVARLEGLGG